MQKKISKYIFFCTKKSNCQTAYVLFLNVAEINENLTITKIP